MIDAGGRMRHAIEVLAQDLAWQENRADAKASTVNLSRNEVLISLVLLGLADVPPSLATTCLPSTTFSWLPSSSLLSVPMLI